MIGVVRSTRVFISLLLVAGASIVVVEGFAGRNPRAAPPVVREDLPTLELPKGAATVDPPRGMTSKAFYPPTYTLIRAGPASFLRRLFVGGKYDQYVWKYMKDYKENSLMSAQGNADAFLASAGRFSCNARDCDVLFFALLHISVSLLSPW
jgi:hypothetical protein